jgi:hypothetical protein
MAFPKTAVTVAYAEIDPVYHPSSHGVRWRFRRDGGIIPTILMTLLLHKHLRGEPIFEFAVCLEASRVEKNCLLDNLRMETSLMSFATTAYREPYTKRCLDRVGASLSIWSALL